VDATDHDPIVVIGDIAHIEGSSDTGPRANRALSAKERDRYENLILLCKNCHAKFDGQKHSNSVAAIKQLRSDHEAWVRSSLPERGRSTIGYKVIVLQGVHPIDPLRAIEALEPDYPNGAPVVLTIPNQGGWDNVVRTLRLGIRQVFTNGDHFEQRFAVFPLAPVSSCIAAGYLLTSRPRVRLFQYHRDHQSWAWPRATTANTTIEPKGLPSRHASSHEAVAVCFHISARILHSRLPKPFARSPLVVDVTVPHPSTSWLRSPDQLQILGETARKVFESLSAMRPNARQWHLFYAGPAPGALAIGQQLNPTMTPPTQLYDIANFGSQFYRPTILLGGAQRDQ
jgi:hypothetical protein